MNQEGRNRMDGADPAVVSGSEATTDTTMATTVKGTTSNTRGRRRSNSCLKQGSSGGRERDHQQRGVDGRGFLRRIHDGSNEDGLYWPDDDENNDNDITGTFNDDDIFNDDSVTHKDDDENEWLYCDQMDDLDEAWVNQHLRCFISQGEDLTKRQQSGANPSSNNSSPPHKSQGKTTTVSSSKKVDQTNDNGRSHNDDDGNSRRREESLSASSDKSKSDAVLSCPCCFQTVCMDCQQHQLYKNQYRAMFVMNIHVDWNQKMVWNETEKCLMKTDVATSTTTTVPPIAASCLSKNIVPHEEGEVELKNSAKAKMKKKKNIDENNDDEPNPNDPFYPVFCQQCFTEVAYLNMSDEVYHFVDCIATAS